MKCFIKKKPVNRFSKTGLFLMKHFIKENRFLKPVLLLGFFVKAIHHKKTKPCPCLQPQEAFPESTRKALRVDSGNAG